jgi:hypothetical protein
MEVSSSVAISRAVGEVRRTVAVAVAVLLGGAACSPRARGAAPRPPSATSTTATTAAATTTTIDPTKAAILAAYRAGWADYIAVAETYPVQPLDPRLSAHSIGKELAAARKALARLSVINHFNRGPTDLSPVVEAVDGDSATVRDCILDHSVEVDAGTNTPVEQPDVGHTRNVFTMTKVNGAWYVSDSTITVSGRTVDACQPG